ncbi:alpha/beta-hydrolase [Meredithblackwellia eburnea MCA 4105]
MTEIIFSSPGGVDIGLDYYLPDQASKERPAPILIWWHGGGLLQGSRKAIWKHLTDSPKLRNYCVVSGDYRLAPQSRLPDIMEDIASLMAYVRSPTFLEKTGGVVDQSKIIVSGGSAGGWLALLAGTGVGFAACGLASPATPTAIAAIYPISDLNDPFWSTKQHPVSYYPRVIPEEEMKEYLDPTTAKRSWNKAEETRSNFYHYMVQEGILAKLLLDGTGISPSEFSIAPQLLTGKFNIPPTFMVHGSIDDKVPLQQALDVDAALEKLNIPHELEVRQGLDHLFDKDPEEKMDRMYAFLAKWV